MDDTKDIQDDIQDEIVETTEDGEALPAGDQLKKLREKLKTAVAEKQQYLDSLQRERADFLNYKKREESEKKELIKFATERLVDDLIPVLQNFEMAFANKEAWEKVDANWRTGVEYIYNHLKQTLVGCGLEEVDPKGEQFDPYRDEALEHLPVQDKAQDHVIMEVVQKGYKLNGKIIRPAKVKVGEFKA
jgi:molecular chaperone GrpE